MDSDGEDFYDSDGEDFYDGEEVEEDAEVVEEEEQQRGYKIVAEEDIKQLQENAISDVCSFLSVSRSVATTLLYQNKWSPTSVCDQWFGDSNPCQLPKSKILKGLCKICYEYQPKMASAPCGHLFCVDCWKIYLGVSIKDGPGCLSLVCPEPGCQSRPGSDMVDSMASADDRERYYRYLYRSFVESNPSMIKWCPSPGCELAIMMEAGYEVIMMEAGYEVVCDCGYKLCWKCGEEFHSPLDCSSVSKWMEKNNSEAENTSWILAYTKPCPMCRKPIEKNQGCNHMTCRKPCSFQFCWLCLGNWTDHSGNCNVYKDKDEMSRENAKKHLEKYTHYYERWDSNDKARKRALADLETAREQHLERLSSTQQETVAQLHYIVDAWDQIVECRRVLKWSYAYGYYLSEVKMQLFGHLQGEAESALERLHHLVEKEMVKYLKAECPLEDFKDFRANLSDLTVVKKKYFGNLVRALENDLREVWI